MFLHFVLFTFWSYYVLKLLRLETLTFSDATLSDINVVLSYVLSQYHKNHGYRRLDVKGQPHVMEWT